MDIAFFHYSYPGIGGTETVTRLLADYFMSQGHNVYVVAWKHGDRGAVPPSVKEVLVLPDQKDFNARENTEKIGDFVRSHNINLIINQGPFWRVEPSVKACGCKVISVLHYSPTYRIENARNAINRLWTHQTGSPVYFAKTAIRRAFIDHFVMADFRKNDRGMLRRMVTDSDAFVVLCDKYVDQFKQLLEIECDHVYAINNPIEQCDCGAENGDEGRKGVVFVGRLTRWDKRVDRLLRIWQRVYNEYLDWNLYIVGDGEERENLEKLAKDLRLKNVEFTGFADPRPYYKKSSIQCMTSSSEGFPMVILEAQQYGLVPIAFNASYGIETVIGDSGVLVAPYDLKEYALRLSKLMAEGLDDSHKDRIKHNISKYSMDNIGKYWDELLKKLYKA